MPHSAHKTTQHWQPLRNKVRHTSQQRATVSSQATLIRTRQVGDGPPVLVRCLPKLLGAVQPVALSLELLAGSQAVLLLRAGLAHAGTSLERRHAGKEGD